MMRRTTVSLLAAATLVAFTATGATAVDTPEGSLDATCNPAGSGGFVIFNNTTIVAQTFVAQHTATMLSAKIFGLHRHPGGIGGPVVVEVRTTDEASGTPTDIVLGTASFPGDQIPVTASIYDAVVHFDPAQAPTLTAADTYALVVSTADTMQNGWNLDDGNPCVGSLWQATSGSWTHYPDFEGSYETYLGASNDAFASSVLLPGTTADSSGSTFGATREADEPDHYVMNVGGDIDWLGDHSVWYRWRSLGSGPVSLDTCVAAIDSIVAVYTGNTLAGLTRVTDGNNGCPSGYGTLLSFDATAGTTYRVAVADAGGARQSTFDLHLAGPPNEPPTITGVRPRNEAEVSDRTPTISATVRDSATNLAAANLVLRLDGQAKAGANYDRGTDLLTFTPGQLALGRHRVAVRAVDAQGEATTRTWFFKVV